MNSRKTHKVVVRKRGAQFTRSQALRPPRIRFLGTIVADATESVVTFNYMFTLKSAAGYYAARPFYTNAPYDVDPALGSTATQGLAELAAFYSKQRVISYTSIVEFASSDVYPLAVVVLHRNTNLSAAGGSLVDFTPYIGNPLVQHALLPHAYACLPKRLTATHTISSIVGTDAPQVADNFASATNSTPADTTYLEIGATINTPVGTFFVNGVTVLLTLRMLTRFYERKQLTT